MTADEAARQPADDDPRPTPPTRPDPDECCHSGCDTCIFDLYEDELTRYRAALAAWEARHAQPSEPAPAVTNKPRKPQKPRAKR
ncbi:oxidoreductase [Paraburkholderia sp. CNPSo 3157]|uniref:Oxidoreductase n=1 Tax=Paraburkholderia franconis TaxID=2654983 RepID=A0A7X1TIZ6_9BURK|nr:oxidoreductase-like domain-containing protein [Paraburkholderia franconis]MPW21015.1 oxidoreductase [Paraburkholderia franconis]